MKAELQIAKRRQN